jgi:hypothetical protein
LANTQQMVMGITNYICIFGHNFETRLAHSSPHLSLYYAMLEEATKKYDLAILLKLL